MDRVSDYDYALPDDRIAQHPADPRDASRLMVVDRTRGTIEHRIFRDIVSLTAPGDITVLNTTRVFRARLLGTRESGGAAEIFLLRAVDATHYEAMVHPGGKLRPGRVVTIASDLRVEIVETTPRRTRIVRIISAESAAEAIERHGHVPLPPYIARRDEPGDEARYQTVYARERGSVAAPTAGLHFTPELLDGLAAHGVARADVLLHVGAGTFKPVQTDDPAQHVMHEEWCEVSDGAARAINETRARGGRVWSVGTTAARVLESAVDDAGVVHPIARDTDIFIRPPHIVRGFDCLITNFHLPRSTLLMLVSAFAGYDLTMRAYREAIDHGYRFYSYGDAMAIV